MKTALNYIGQVAKAAAAGALAVAGTAVVNQSFDWKALVAGACVGIATFLVPNKKGTP
jgi:hypothetical protein